MIVSVDSGLWCDLRAVDFDDDGDVDLFIGQDRYFKRLTPTLLIEQSENPIAMFDGNVMQIADVDGDGRLEVLVRKGANFRTFRQSLDGGFVEPMDNPLGNSRAQR